MIIRILAFAFSSINRISIKIQILISRGLPTYTIVGLVGTTITEFHERF